MKADGEPRHGFVRELIGLRGRMLGLVLLAVLPPIALVIDANHQARSAALEAARAEYVRLAELTALAVRARVEGARELLVLLGRLPVVRSLDRVKIDALCAELVRDMPEYANVGFVGLDGLVIGDGPHSLEPLDLSPGDWFQRALEAQDLVIGDYQVGATTGEPTIDFARTARSESGAPLGVAWVSMRLGRLDELVRSVVLPAGAAVFVADANGTILARSPDGIAYVGQSQADAVASALDDDRRSLAVELQGVDGVDRLYALERVASVGGGGLLVGVGVPSAAVLAAADAPYERALAGLVVVAILALAASGLAAEVLVVRRVHALVEASRQLASGHEEQRSGLPHGPDELGRLAAAFDAMAASIETRDRQRRAAEEEASRLNADLERRVAERTAELQAANGDLEAFSYSVSHDLRAPVRHIAGFAALLERHLGERLDASSHHDLGAIRASAERMNRLIDDILAFSRLGRAGLRLERVELAPLLRQAWAELAPETEGRAVELQAGPLPAVRADPQMLHQALVNLLSNALKYTRPRAQAVIAVSAERSSAGGAPELVLAVSDNGVGFDMQYAGKLFGVFQRLHDASVFEGTGIGLAIVRRIVERHGGRTWAKSAPDAGATFFLSLPLEDTA